MIFMYFKIQYANIRRPALGIIIAGPGFWIIVTILIFVVFLLYQRCDATLKKKKKLTPLKWTLSVFALLCCGALSLGLFGNEETHNGMKSAKMATENMEKIVQSVQNKTTEFEYILNSEISEELDTLTDLLKEPILNSTNHVFLQVALACIKRNVSKGAEQLREIKSNIDLVDLQKVPETIHEVEIFRRLVTVVILYFLIFSCLILLFGIIQHSRWLLIFFSVMGIVSVVLCWVLVSLYLGLCFAVSDFCVHPEPFLYKQAQSSINTNVVSYYLHCDHMVDNPFTIPIKEITMTVNNMDSTVNVLIQITGVLYPEQQVRATLHHLSTKLNSAEKTVSGMVTLLDCQAMHKEYVIAMQATCVDVLEGMVYMFVSAAGAGVFFSVLIWLASHTWIQIHEKSGH
ncbi:protein tweety-like isoform X1 [Tachypleus tridentatus]|uniref:protein tweety-like isoform X1 n=1 Tax=Tachypleus tridentatus TaxID=6853 RepID=UPI003FD10B42